MSFESIEAAARRDASRGEWLLRFAQAAQTIVIPALIAAMVWFRADIQKAGSGLFFFLLVVLIICQIVLFWISQSAKHSVQDLYFASKDLNDRLIHSTREAELYRAKTELFILIEKFAMTCARPLLDYRGQVITEMKGLTTIIAKHS